MKITGVLEQTKNNWGAFTTGEIGSVIAVGDTREETIDRFCDALQFHLEGMRERGMAIPDVTELEIRGTVAA